MIQEIPIEKLKIHPKNVRKTYAGIEELADSIKAKGIPVIVYEPALKEQSFFGSPVVTDLSVFKSQCDLIITNRKSTDLADVSEKVFTRDIFSDN